MPKNFDNGKRNMDEVLKGNYKIPDAKMPKKPEDEGDKNSENLEKEFEAAATKKLGGSVTFVKKKGSGFTWRGKK